MKRIEVTCDHRNSIIEQAVDEADAEKQFLAAFPFCKGQELKCRPLGMAFGYKAEAEEEAEEEVKEEKPKPAPKKPAPKSDDGA